MRLEVGVEVAEEVVLVADEVEVMVDVVAVVVLDPECSL